MPTVPQYEIGQVKSRSIRARQNIDTPADAFGANIAKAQSDMAKVLQQQYEIQRDEYEQGVLRQLDNDYSSYIRSAMSGNNGYLSLQGRAALDAKAGVEQGLKEKLESLSKGIDQRLVNRWDTMSQSRYQSALGRLDSHNSAQTVAFNQLQTKARIGNQQQEMGALFDYEAEVQKAKKIGLTEIDAQLVQQGIDPKNPRDDKAKDIIKAARLGFTTVGHGLVIDNLIKNNRPAEARVYFEKYREEIHSGQHDDILGRLDSHTKKGQVLIQTEKIWAMDLTIEEKREMARDLDPNIVEDVVRALNTRKQEKNDAITERNEIAKDKVAGLIANGGTKETIDPDLWDAMGHTNGFNMENVLAARAQKKTQDSEKIADDIAKTKARLGEVITTEEWNDMSPSQALILGDWITENARKEGTDEEKEAHDAALKIIGAAYDSGSSITETIAEMKKEGGLWEKMSGAHQNSIRSSINAANKVTKEATDKFNEQKLWMVLEKEATENYESFKNINLEMYVGLISNSNLDKLRQMQKSPEAVATSQNRLDYVKSALGSMGLDYDDFDKEKGSEVRRFIDKIDLRTKTFFDLNNKNPSDDEYKKIILEVQGNMVWDDSWIDEEVPLFSVDPEDFENIYVKVNGEDFYLKEIPDLERARIVDAMRNKGIPISEQAIANAYVNAERMQVKMQDNMQARQDSFIAPEDAKKAAQEATTNKAAEAAAKKSAEAATKKANEVAAKKAAEAAAEAVKKRDMRARQDASKVSEDAKKIAMDKAKSKAEAAAREKVKRAAVAKAKQELALKRSKKEAAKKRAAEAAKKKSQEAAAAKKAAQEAAKKKASEAAKKKVDPNPWRGTRSKEKEELWDTAAEALGSDFESKYPELKAHLGKAKFETTKAYRTLIDIFDALQAEIKSRRESKKK